MAATRVPEIKRPTNRGAAPISKQPGSENEKKKEAPAGDTHACLPRQFSTQLRRFQISHPATAIPESV